MNIEERLKRLEDKVNDLMSDKMFLNHNRCGVGNGYITTEDVLRAVCKKSNIDIIDIDTTPTNKYVQITNQERR